MLKKTILICAVMCMYGKSEAHTTKHVIAHHDEKRKNKPHKHMSMRKQTGLASYYGPGFWGKHTSNGHIMRPGDMTVAHKTYPLGTKLRVVNQENGRSVIVTVDDRGPYVGKRIIDIAERPARILDMKKEGLAHVSIFPISIPDENVMEVASFDPKGRKYKPLSHHHH